MLVRADGKSLEPPRQDVPQVKIDYNIEGSDLGYRWFARTGQKPLFPFGHGLTYTSFGYSDLKVTGGDAPTATFTVSNTGQREGIAVPQVYVQLPDRKIPARLAGWQTVRLKPGESRTVTVTAEPRILASYDTSLVAWRIDPGTYRFSLAASAEDVKLTGAVNLEGRLIEP